MRCSVLALKLKFKKVFLQSEGMLMKIFLGLGHSPHFSASIGPYYSSLGPPHSNTEYILWLKYALAGKWENTLSGNMGIFYKIAYSVHVSPHHVKTIHTVSLIRPFPSRFFCTFYVQWNAEVTGRPHCLANMSCENVCTIWSEACTSSVEHYYFWKDAEARILFFCSVYSETSLQILKTILLCLAAVEAFWPPVFPQCQHCPISRHRNFWDFLRPDL